MGAIKMVNWAKRMGKRVRSFRKRASILPLDSKQCICLKRKPSGSLNMPPEHEQIMDHRGLSKKSDSVLELSQDIEKLDCTSLKDLSPAEYFADDELNKDSYTTEIKMEAIRNFRISFSDFGSNLQSFESMLIDYSGEFDSRTMSVSLLSLPSINSCEFVDISRSKKCYHVQNQQDKETTKIMPPLPPTYIDLPQKYVHHKNFIPNTHYNPSKMSTSHLFSNITTTSSFDCHALESLPQNKSTKTEIEVHGYMILERGPILFCQTIPGKGINNKFDIQIPTSQEKGNGMNFCSIPKTDSADEYAFSLSKESHMVLEKGPVLICPALFVKHIWNPPSQYRVVSSELKDDLTNLEKDEGLYKTTAHNKYYIEKSKITPSPPENLEKMLKKLLLKFGKVVSSEYKSASSSREDLLSLSDRFFSNLTSNPTLEAFPKKSFKLIRKILYLSNQVPSVQELFCAYPLHRVNITGSKSEVALEDPMRFEWQRIRSFHSYPTSDLGVSIIHLAQNGFYYTGRGSETTCFFCKCKYSDWRLDSDVRRTHLQLSPECSVAMGRESSNVPIHPIRRRENVPQQVDPFSGIDRFDENIAEDGGESGAALALQSPIPKSRSNHISSLPQVSVGNVGENASFNLPEFERTRSNRQEDRPRTEHMNISYEAVSSTQIGIPHESNSHQKKNPESHNQRLVNSSREGRSSTPNNTDTQSASSNAAKAYKQKLSSQLDPLGIVWEKPKFPSYAILSARVSSFEGWSENVAQSPTVLSKAGYFYVGIGDYVRCFFCGGGLRNWERSDVPWEEHAKWFPRCAFLRNVKGEEYVSLVQCNSQTNDFGQTTQSEGADQNHVIFEILKEEGYPRDRIQSAINVWEQRRDKVGYKLPMKAEDLIDVLEEDNGDPANTCTSVSQQPEELQTLQKEFTFLQSTLLCKVCFKQEVGMAFLPCGHLVCCKECAPAIRKCLLCDVIIKGTVKTYFS